MFCKQGVLRNFAKFTGKHLCQSLFLNKVAGLRLLRKAFLERDSGTSKGLLLSFYKNDNGKFNVRQTKEQKDSFTEKKRKAWNRQKRTQMPVTLTEVLAAVFAGELCH